MLFVYLDEFGHVGPYFSRASQVYNESPVFGLGGVILQDSDVRNFATFILQQKERLLKEEIAKSGKIAAKWEKKGASFIRQKPLERYPNVKRTLFRIINRLERGDGKIFYYGREKKRNRTDLNANGLYKTVFSHAIRKINAYCEDRNEKFIIVVDQHSARKELLETSVKTMYGSEPCRCMASPPFEVESYVNQNIQAADWVATILGRMWAYAVQPDEFRDCEVIDTFFGDRVQNLAVRSELLRRQRVQKRLVVREGQAVPAVPVDEG